DQGNSACDRFQRNPARAPGRRLRRCRPISQRTRRALHGAGQRRLRARARHPRRDQAPYRRSIGFGRTFPRGRGRPRARPKLLRRPSLHEPGAHAALGDRGGARSVCRHVHARRPRPDRRSDAGARDGHHPAPFPRGREADRAYVPWPDRARVGDAAHPRVPGGAGRGRRRQGPGDGDGLALRGLQDDDLLIQRRGMGREELPRRQADLPYAQGSGAGRRGGDDQPDKLRTLSGFRPRADHRSEPEFRPRDRGGPDHGARARPRPRV
ncbi:MAG: ThiJ/PfpI family protein, partial [uncultured Sphingomonadaceae bacterium]